MLIVILVAEEVAAPTAYLSQQLQTGLAASAYRLRCATSCAAAVACVQAEPDLDILLLPLELPDLGQVALLGEQLAPLRHGQRVVVSTRDQLPTLQTMLPPENFVFVCQPFEVPDLLAAIEQAAHYERQRAAPLSQPANTPWPLLFGQLLASAQQVPTAIRAACQTRFALEDLKPDLTPPAKATTVPRAASGSVQTIWLRNLYALLDAHLDKPDLSVEWLAAQLCMSRKTLLRRIRRLLNRTPHDVIQQHRLRRGAELLQAGHSVAQAAYAVGFNTPTHFGQRFKQLYRVTPRHFSGRSRAAQVAPS